MESPQPVPQAMVILSAGLLWYLSSILVNISWKQAFHNHPDVLTLTFIQVAVAELTSLPILFCYKLKHPDVLQSVGQWKKSHIVMIGFAFAFGQLCTNVSLSLVSVSLTHVIKITEPVIALIFGVTILKDKVPPSAMVYVVFLLVGVAIATVQDATFHYKGILYAGLSNVALQIRNLNVKLLKSHQSANVNSIVLFVLTNAITVLTTFFLVILNAFYQGSFPLLAQLDIESVKTGVWLTGQHIMSYFVLQKVLISTHALLNVTKRLLIIVVCAVILHTHLSVIQFVGISMALAGFYLYTMAMSNDEKSISSTVAKSKKCVWVIIILIIASLCAFSSISRISSVVEQRYEKMPAIATGTTGKNNAITAFWVYSKGVDESKQNLINILSQSDPSRKITVYCGSVKCLKALEYHDKVQVKQLQVLSLSNGTTISAWVRRHALMKILTGPDYEKHLQKAVNLAFLWKFGGYVLDLELPVADEELFASKLDLMKDNSCTLGHQTVPLGLCKLEKNHPFVEKLMQTFISSFKVKAEDTWPFKADFTNMLESTLKTQIQAGKNNTIPNDVTIDYQETLGPVKSFDNDNNFGLVHYVESENIGDEVQSIASAHFLPRIDVLLPRDKVIQTPKRETTALINAFWRPYSWIYGPMTNIRPIPLAIHVARSSDKAIQDKWIAKKSYFAKYGNVGTRDTATLAALQKIGVPSQMTGCVTPFIQNPFQGMPRTNKIYFVDVDKYIKELIPSRIRARAIFIKQVVVRKQSNGLPRYVNAYNRLEKFARAHLIITTRIHCALPCVAMGTPVIFLNLKTLNDATPEKESGRVSGLTDLFHGINEYKQTRKEMKHFFDTFDYDNPPPNPNPDLANTYRQSGWSILQQVDEMKDTHNLYELRP